LEPARYKGAYGGRGSGKSHFLAEQLIEDSQYYKGLNSVCVREVQKTLKHSAKKLLQAKITEFGLGEKDGFKIFNDAIKTPGDGVILFQGMQDHNAESIKSLEDFNRAWIEEAQTLSQTSLRLLRPTIRADDSEIWASWNPRRKIDPVDVMLRQGTRPTGAVVVRANWSDNPWFPDVLNQERLDCLRDDPDQYDHIWEGGYVSVIDGAYFCKHIAEARKENRIGIVNPDPLIKYRAFSDLGGTGARSDAFVFWVAQFVGLNVRVVNYYEAQGQPLSAHLAWLAENGYTPANTGIWLPHDGETHDRVFDVSFESAFSQAGFEVEVIPNQGKGAAKQRVEAARRLFPSIYIDERKCEAGLEALGWYHEKKDEHRNVGLGPEHDWSSHGADAFGLMCVAHQPPQQAGITRIKKRGWGGR
jgi:phage terminase large subunit